MTLAARRYAGVGTAGGTLNRQFWLILFPHCTTSVLLGYCLDDRLSRLLPRTHRRTCFNISKLISQDSVVVRQIELISLEVIKLAEQQLAHVLQLPHDDSRSNSQLGCKLNNRLVIPWPTTKEMAHFLTWYE